MSESHRFSGIGRSIKQTGLLHLSVLGLALLGCARPDSHSSAAKATCCASDSSEAEAGGVGTVGSKSSSLLVTEWLPANRRLKSLPIGLTFTNGAGDAGCFKELVGKPLAISFLYTRCENPNKCARVANTMASLEAELEKTGLRGKVRLLLITYDPEFDTPIILEKYGTRHGLRFDGDTMMLQLDPKEKTRLFDNFEVAVNFNSSGVNIHGIQLLLFDAQGRWVRTYHTLVWNNADVLADLQSLVKETALSANNQE